MLFFKNFQNFEGFWEIIFNLIFSKVLPIEFCLFQTYRILSDFEIFKTECFKNFKTRSSSILLNIIKFLKFQTFQNIHWPNFCKVLKWRQFCKFWNFWKCGQVDHLIVEIQKTSLKMRIKFSVYFEHFLSKKNIASPINQQNNTTDS